MTRQGKLLTKLNPWYVRGVVITDLYYYYTIIIVKVCAVVVINEMKMLGFLRACLGWSIETYVSKLSNIFLSQSCVQKYLVFIGLGLHLN